MTEGAFAHSADCVPLQGDALRWAERICTGEVRVAVTADGGSLGLSQCQPCNQCKSWRMRKKSRPQRVACAQTTIDGRGRNLNICRKLGGEGDCCFRFTDGWAGRCLAVEIVASAGERPDRLLAATRALPTPFLYRLWKKVWAPVPTPESFFQPLYREHSGDFKVSRLGCPLWTVCPLGESYRP